MSDERLRRWLETLEQPLTPDPRFATGLRDELRSELGFVPASSPSAMPAHVRRTRSRGRPWRMLLIAAVLTLVAGGLALIAGSMLDGPPIRRSALFDQVERTGSVRIAIRPDHPQFSIAGQPAAGFDADVGRALAGQLALRGDIYLTDAPVMLTGEADDTWDIALPSVAAASIDRSRFLVSAPYYRWPRWLLVPEDSVAQAAGDLAGSVVCAVAGDAGEAWARGLGDAGSGTDGGQRLVRVVTRSTDEECLATMEAGEVAGMVTARWSDADVRVHSGMRIVGGPEPEPRAVILRRADGAGPDPMDLLAAIDSALEAMRRDGTLSSLSHNRFGGADLTAL